MNWTKKTKILELRADALPTEYLRKAREADRTYCGTLEGDQGPVEARLRSFPPLVKLVVGPNAECSEDLHDLLNSMAENRLIWPWQKICLGKYFAISISFQ